MNRTCFFLFWHNIFMIPYFCKKCTKNLFTLFILSKLVFYTKNLHPPSGRFLLEGIPLRFWLMRKYIVFQLHPYQLFPWKGFSLALAVLLIALFLIGYIFSYSIFIFFCRIDMIVFIPIFYTYILTHEMVHTTSYCFSFSNTP